MDKDRGGGSARWIKQILIVNIINFAEVNKGGGVKRLSTKKVDSFRFFWKPSLRETDFSIETFRISVLILRVVLRLSVLQS